MFPYVPIAKKYIMHAPNSGARCSAGGTRLWKGTGWAQFCKMKGPNP